MVIQLKERVKSRDIFSSLIQNVLAKIELRRLVIWPLTGLNFQDQKIKTSWYMKFIKKWKEVFGNDLLVLDADVLKKTPWESVIKVEKHLSLPSQVTKESFAVGPRVMIFVSSSDAYFQRDFIA